MRTRLVLLFAIEDQHVLVPDMTPAEIVDKLNQEINAALADPNIKARFLVVTAKGRSPPVLMYSIDEGMLSIQ